MSMRKYKSLSRELVEFFSLHGIKVKAGDVAFTNRITHADPLRSKIEREVTLTFWEEITDEREISRIIQNTPTDARSQ